MTTYSNYPKERKDPLDTNEELVCFFCKKPVKEINDTLTGHSLDCKYRLKHQPTTS
jgi:hypothetical protein